MPKHSTPTPKGRLGDVPTAPPSPPAPDAATSAVAGSVPALAGAPLTELKIDALQMAIFNSANFSCIATDDAGVIQIFNVGAERMLGYAAQDVINKITPADLSDAQELVARAAELSVGRADAVTPGFQALVFKASRGIEDIYDLTYIRKDGSRLPAVVSVTALRNAQDRIIGYLLIGTDNTERQQVEARQTVLDQRLRDQQFYTRSLVESNVDALMVTDRQGVISDVNQQMITLTGRSRDELIGAPCRSFFTNPVLAEAALAQALNGNRVRDYELTVCSLGGKETVVSYSADTYYNRDRELQGVFASARDITERKQFERALQEKNIELVHASRMKSEFLATMSHELRTPLNAIIGFSEALNDGLVGAVTERQKAYIGDIFESGQHLLSLINDILDLSKVEAGMMSLDLDPADIRELLSNSLSVVREKSLAQGISLTLTVEPERAILDIDVRKVKQIVYNLLSNAVKFSAKGDDIALRARRVPRSAVATMDTAWPVYGFPLAENAFQEFLEISVSDDGVGIARENLAKLFQAFTQIDSTLARRFEGTGLGLAMVKQLAELHGGTVAVASAVGEGSRFAAWLPLRAASQLAEGAPWDGAPAAGGGRVGAEALAASRTAAPAVQRLALVVEDNRRDAELVRLLLESEGFTVLVANSAEEGLQIAPGHDLALITLDIQLPNLHGWEFLRRLRAIDNLANVPVIVISGRPDSNLTLTRGAAAVLTKPISRAQLRNAVGNLRIVPADRIHNVLVVDDNPAAIELVAGLLPPTKYSLVRASNGEDAIRLADEFQPDLVLLDLMMPGCTGFEVAAALQRNPRTTAIPILVVTAKQVTAADRTALARDSGGSIEIVQKASFDRGAFLDSVRRALQDSRAPNRQGGTHGPHPDH